MREAIRKKDVYVLLVLTLVIVGGVTVVQFMNIEGATRIMREISLHVIGVFAAILAILTSANQLPADRQWGTIYPILAKPVTRLQYLFGKLAGCSLLSIVSYLLFYVVLAVMLASIGGGLTGMMLRAAYLRCLEMVLICALVICLSTVLTHGANVTLSLILVGFFRWVPGVLDRRVLPELGDVTGSIVKTFDAVMPHLEFHDLTMMATHDWQAIHPAALPIVTIYTAGYVAVLMGIAGLLFNRQEI